MMTVTIGTLENRPLHFARRGAQRAYAASMFLLSRAGEIVWHGVVIATAFFLVAYVALLGDELLVFPAVLLCLHVLWESVGKLTDNQLVFPGVFMLSFIGAVGLASGMLQPPFSVTLALAGAVGLAGSVVFILIGFIWETLNGHRIRPPVDEETTS